MKNGITITELLIVLLVMCLLASITIKVGARWRLKAQDKNAHATVEVLAMAISQYRDNIGYLPTSRSENLYLALCNSTWKEDLRWDASTHRCYDPDCRQVGCDGLSFGIDSNGDALTGAALCVGSLVGDCVRSPICAGAPHNVGENETGCRGGSPTAPCGYHNGTIVRPRHGICPHHRFNPNWRGPYLSSLEKDPWGRTYEYKAVGETFRVYSLGPDGLTGLEDLNGDGVPDNKDDVGIGALIGE